MDPMVDLLSDTQPKTDLNLLSVKVQ